VAIILVRFYKILNFHDSY